MDPATGQGVLHWACSAECGTNRSIEMVQLLMQKPIEADIHAVANACGQSPLHFACSGHAEVAAAAVAGAGGAVVAPPVANAVLLQWMLTHGGANVHATVHHTNQTPLHVACGHELNQDSDILVAVVECLIQGGLPTPLPPLAQPAAAPGINPTNGANLYAIEVNGRTALHFACRFNRLRIVRCLTHHDSQNDATPKLVDVADLRGCTALHYCVGTANHTTILQHLIQDCQADADLADENGWTLLHKASVENQTHVIPYLVRHGQLEVNAQTTNGGRTALHLAAAHGHVDFVAALVEDTDVDVTMVDDNNQTAWQLALHPDNANVHPQMEILLNPQPAAAGGA